MERNCKLHAVHCFKPNCTTSFCDDELTRPTHEQWKWQTAQQPTLWR